MWLAGVQDSRLPLGRRMSTGTGEQQGKAKCAVEKQMDCGNPLGSVPSVCVCQSCT